MTNVTNLQAASQVEKQKDTTRHLEYQLNLALSLQSPRDYRIILENYVRKLTEFSDETRLQQLCSQFIGPPTHHFNKEWEPQILIFSKRKLLGELLPIMGTNRNLQRMIQDVAEMLQKFKSTHNSSNNNTVNF
jgi:protein HIRA/HIR1